MRVRFKAIGRINQISPSTVDFPPNVTAAALKKHIILSLRMPPNSPLWIYVANAFVPTDDTTLETIAGMSSNTDVVITYSEVEAFG